MKSLLKRRTVLATLLFSGVSGVSGGASCAWGRPATVSVITMRFELPEVSGNPFDFAENDVQVELSSGRRKLTVPAFFDGGTTWEMRCTPLAKGTWRVRRILRNGQPATAKNSEPREWAVVADTAAIFVRRDAKNPRFFAYASGAPYYPIGCNAAWNSGKVTVESFLADMGRAGQNWSRIWMNHWDGKNLDWVSGETLAPGYLSLAVARRWDAVVAAAERASVPFQMVFQHHGQYSTQVNPNWDDNPWNAKNGGFLRTPEEFFTSDVARQRTRAKYRYILARYGYSPHILAWELFNEVQFTDTGRKHGSATIAAWHKEMAAFIRKHDVHRHMITTSSDEGIAGLYTEMDYRQPHAYPSDLVGTIRTVGDTFASGKASGGNDPRQPVFLGEIGQSGDLQSDTGTSLRQILWASLMSAAPGAAQYWTWDNIGKRDLTGAWKPATDFVRRFRLPARRGMKPVALAVTGANRSGGATTFGAGGGWEGAKTTRYAVDPSGEVAGIGAMSPYLQGDNNRALLPFVEFAVTYSEPGTFAITIGQVSRNGANVQIQVDGKTLAQKAFAAAAIDTSVSATLSVAVPAGAHSVRLENTGQDWARIESFTLTPFGAPARVVAKADNESVAAWVYVAGSSDATPLTATVGVPGLDAGKYRVYWWDTATGKVVKSETATAVSGKPLEIRTPPIMGNVALFAAHERTGNYTT